MKTILFTALVLASAAASAAGEFESLQWALKNRGVPIELKLTDIDRLTLPARSGEDIRVSGLKEIGGRKIRVAIIDSGIDLSHPDLAQAIYRNEGECAAWDQYQACLAQNLDDEEKTKACHDRWAKTDTDGNGYPMDCRGWNVAAPVNPRTGVQGNNDVMDIVGHGTHIAGIIAAAQDEVGISGVLQNVEILPVKVSGSAETITEDTSTDIFAKGILYALQQNVDIINLSVGWASGEDSVLVNELINKAHEMGVLVVIAGGNSAHSTETYPCAYNEVICVGAHNPDGSRSHFSNFGTSIDLYAPGHNILSTWPLELRPKLFTARHGYEFKNGTSFSAPYVVGALARLLNLGFSPDEARVKLLGGARKPNLNLDLARAATFEAKSFIYPYKKSAAFMNWHEGEKKFILRVKNYLRDARNVELRLVAKDDGLRVKDPTVRFPQWSAGEIKDLSFTLEGDEHVPSEMYFDMQVRSTDESKTYPVQVVATTVIHDRFQRADAKRIAVNSNRDLGAFDFLPVENIAPGKDTDFLVSQLIDGKVAIGLLKLMDGQYRLSRLHQTIFTKALIIQAAKVDVDQDGKLEYVVTGMYQNKDLKWLARFYVFDENFRASELEICPGNEHTNLLTSMSTELRWMKRGGRMVPTWMALGYAPSIDLPAFDPWAPRVSNGFKKRIYYLDRKGLRTLNLPVDDWATFSPVKFFPPTISELREGRIKFLYTLDEGFVKTYSVADTLELKPIANFVMARYQNLYPLEGMTQANGTEILFGENDAGTGRGRVSVLDPAKSVADQQEFSYVDPLDSVQLFITQTDAGNFFGHTKYNLLYFADGNVHKTESHNASNLIQYKRLRGREALYLSSKHTPGLSAEMVQFDGTKLERPAKYRFLLGTGCQELGYHYSAWEEQDQVLFYCDRSKSVFEVVL